MTDTAQTPPHPALVMDPPADARAAVIWLHGLGADGHDFEPVVPALGLLDAGVRFVFPHAPQRRVTINNGMRMRAWYDVFDRDFTSEQDAAGIRASEGIVRDFIQWQNDAGIPADRIVLAGFSQGGAVVLHTGLRHPERLAGILALSTYLPLADTVETEAADANRDVPIYMAHGTEDPVIALRDADASQQRLNALGYPVTWRTWPMPHTVVMEELEDFRDWLRARLGVA